MTTVTIREEGSVTGGIGKGYYKTGKVKWFFEDDLEAEVTKFGSMRPGDLKPWMISEEFCIEESLLIKTEYGFEYRH